MLTSCSLAIKVIYHLRIAEAVVQKGNLGGKRGQYSTEKQQH